MGVLAVVGVAAAGVGAVVLAPLVSLARHGTLEQRTVAGWREEAARVEALRRARHRAALVASVPAPRGAEHEQRRTSPTG